MNAELISWLAILASFSLYGVLSGVELGVAATRVEPRLAPPKSARRMFTPRLEITNVLLAMGCAGLGVIFPDAAVVILRETWPVLALGLIALLLRAGLLAYLFLHKAAPGSRVLNYLFALSSFTVPLSLGSAGIFMVTGQPFWQTGVGMALFGSLVIGLLALGMGFVYFVGGRQAPLGVVLTSRLLNLVLAGLLAIAMVGMLQSGAPHLLNLSYAYLAIIAAGLVLAQAVCMAAHREWRMWWCLGVLTALAPFLIGLANYPYLIFPDVMLAR